MSLLMSFLNTQKKIIIYGLLLLCAGQACQLFASDSDSDSDVDSDSDNVKQTTFYSTAFDSDLSAAVVSIVGACAASDEVPVAVRVAGAGLATVAFNQVADELFQNLNPACLKVLFAYAACALASKSITAPLFPSLLAATAALFSYSFVKNQYPEANETVQQVGQAAVVASASLTPVTLRLIGPQLLSLITHLSSLGLTLNEMIVDLLDVPSSSV